MKNEKGIISFTIKKKTNLEIKGQKRYRALKGNSKTTEIRPTLSIITLNINGLNFSIKRQRLAG